MQDQLTHQAVAAEAVATMPRSRVIVQWTRQDIRALRLALRMTNEEFAAHLSVAPRTVLKWNAHPRHVTVPELQPTLDAVLDQAPVPARERFALAPMAGERA
jgi:8-oxo-dGTP diphosphatase